MPNLKPEDSLTELRFNRSIQPGMNLIAAGAYPVRGPGTAGAEGWPMETKIATLILFAMTAGMAAIALLLVMHHDLDLIPSYVPHRCPTLCCDDRSCLVVALLKFPATK
jgi:hypothetical protein